MKHAYRRSLIAACFLMHCWGAQANPLQLITTTEAQLPDAKPANTRAITRGPSIRLASPAEVQATSFALRIALEPRGGAKIDPQSVQVQYLKEPPVDLTPRMQNAIQAAQIDLPMVSVPKGTHHLRVSVKDSEGRATATIISLHAQ